MGEKNIKILIEIEWKVLTNEVENLFWRKIEKFLEKFKRFSISEIGYNLEKFKNLKEILLSIKKN